MKSKSQWENTKTFFSQFLRAIENEDMNKEPICVVGAADGRFVIPLAEKKFSVIAVEQDPLLIYGGEYENTSIQGLIPRLREEGLRKHVQLLHSDFRQVRIPKKCAAVFTSCSWHYPENYDTPLSDFIKKMQLILCKDGLFCAEYMMACTDTEEEIEHYLKNGQILKYFPKRHWNIIENKYTDPFKENPHIGKENIHIHKIGFILAHKKSQLI